GLAGNEQFGKGIDLELFQVLQLPFKDYRVDDHPVAHDVDGLLVENSRGNGVQYVFYPVELQGMPGIGPSLKSGDNIVFLGQYINNFSFSFVPPLESKQ